MGKTTLLNGPEWNSHATCRSGLSGWGNRRGLCVVMGLQTIEMGFTLAANSLFASAARKQSSHTASPWEIRDTIILCLHSEFSGRITGSLRSALRWESHRQSWFEIRFILKVRHTMVHDAEYDELLWIVSHKLSDTFAYQSLSVDSL